MNQDIKAYNEELSDNDKEICETLMRAINNELSDATAKVWHAHPIWFLNDNPIVGYHKLKDNVRLMFWSGQSFDEPGLVNEGSFKTAEARYYTKDEINIDDLKRWLEKSRTIQWDYKNIVKRKGLLERL